LLTGMTGNSLHMQWPLTSHSHGSVSQIWTYFVLIGRGALEPYVCAPLAPEQPLEKGTVDSPRHKWVNDTNCRTIFWLARGKRIEFWLAGVIWMIVQSNFRPFRDAWTGLYIALRSEGGS
jgi:hypothetical protein